jgi:hypothetical protein
MCSRDKTISLHMPFYILLILVVCACNLALHFVAEGLAPVTGGPGYDLSTQGGQAHPVNEHSEDNFIFPSLTCLSADHPEAALQSIVATETRSFPISPLLPPPNS